MPPEDSVASPPAPLGADGLADAQSRFEQPRCEVWVNRLTVTDFRNYAQASIELPARPVILTGANGIGKTNLLEAVSLLTAGQGLRRAPYVELNRAGARGKWAVSARVHGRQGPVTIGTGLASRGDGEAGGRVVRVDQQTVKSSGLLGDHLQMIWLTPSLDGLFTGPASERRRFIDRLVSGFDLTYRAALGQFERAMRQRNRLLELDGAEASLFAGLEQQMAQTGVAIAAARNETFMALAGAIERRRSRLPHSQFPWAEIALDGGLEAMLMEQAAVDVEDVYAARLAANRERDRAARRALEGPHRSDLLVGHGPKALPAKICSTGEQKALLIGLILAHADLLKHRHGGAAPILLLDEIAAHLDNVRRSELYGEVLALGSQAWMTGTDRSAFSALENQGYFLAVGPDGISQSPRNML